MILWKEEANGLGESLTKFFIQLVSHDSFASVRLYTLLEVGYGFKDFCQWCKIMLHTLEEAFFDCFNDLIQTG